MNFYSKSRFGVTKEEINRPKLQFPMWMDIEKRWKQSVYISHIFDIHLFFFSVDSFWESIRIADGSKTNDHNHTYKIRITLQ